MFYVVYYYGWIQSAKCESGTDLLDRSDIFTADVNSLQISLETDIDSSRKSRN